MTKYDGWHFAEVDKVRLKKMAEKLRAQIFQKIRKEEDPYLFYSKTMPVLEATIQAEITQSLDEDKTNFTRRNYYHAKSEGTLPQEYDREFTGAAAEFSVTAEALSLEESETAEINGITYKWRNVEEEINSI